MRKADALLGQGKAEAALGVLLDLRNAHPQFEPGLWQLAETLAALGRHEDALDVYQELGHRQPRSAKPWQAMAELCVQANWVNAAEEYVKVASEIAPFEPRTRLVMGQCHEARQQWQEAADAVYPALANLPADAARRLRVGDCLVRVGRPTAACRLYEFALKCRDADLVWNRDDPHAKGVHWLAAREMFVVRFDEAADRLDAFGAFLKQSFRVPPAATCICFWRGNAWIGTDGGLVYYDGKSSECARRCVGGRAELLNAPVKSLQLDASKQELRCTCVHNGTDACFCYGVKTQAWRAGK